MHIVMRIVLFIELVKFSSVVITLVYTYRHVYVPFLIFLSLRPTAGGAMAVLFSALSPAY